MLKLPPESRVQQRLRRQSADRCVEHLHGMCQTAELPSRLGVEHVPHPGRAAADLGRGDLAQRRAGDVEQPARLGPHALRVREVAGIVVRHRQRQWVPGRHRAELDEYLGRVSHLAGERGGALRV